MADFEPPSFSLGLDFDFDSEPQTTVRKDPLLSEQARPSSSNPSFRLIEDDDDFEIPTMGREPIVSEPPKGLKRLRLGPGSESTPAAQKRKSVELRCNVDDEIKEFSSQEDRLANEHSSTQYRSGCSSSKLPLHGHGVLTMQSASQLKAMKRKQASNAPASASLETSTNKLMFPKSTVSPLRRFQLVGYDSDDPFVSEDVNREANKLGSSLKEKQYNSGQYPTTSGQKKITDFYTEKSFHIQTPVQKKITDFYPEKSFHIPTPALDKFCEEYFRSVKDKSEVQNPRHDKCINDNKGFYQNCNVINNDEHQCKLGDVTVPAHHYFFNDDPRIQKLVRSRLPYFCPLGAMNNRGNKNPISSVIDYMSQFNHGEASKQPAARKIDAETSPTRKRKNSKKSNAEEVTEASGSWVDPRSSADIPKVAGKRQAHAVGQSAGQWFTGPDGRRVYVTKNGQELTDQIAYRHYKKESGAGFKKSVTKAAAKKKAATKKDAATKEKSASKKKAATKKEAAAKNDAATKEKAASKKEVTTKKKAAAKKKVATKNDAATKEKAAAKKKVATKKKTTAKKK